MRLRICDGSGERILPASRELVAQACGRESWPALLAAQDAARQRVRELWHTVSATREK